MIPSDSRSPEQILGSEPQKRGPNTLPKGRTGANRAAHAGLQPCRVRVHAQKAGARVDAGVEQPRLDLHQRHGGHGLRTGGADVVFCSAEARS